MTNEIIKILERLSDDCIGIPYNDLWLTGIGREAKHLLYLYHEEPTICPLCKKRMHFNISRPHHELYTKDFIFNPENIIFICQDCHEWIHNTFGFKGVKLDGFNAFTHEEKIVLKKEYKFNEEDYYV